MFRSHHRLPLLPLSRLLLPLPPVVAVLLLHHQPK